MKVIPIVRAALNRRPHIIPRWIPSSAPLRFARVSYLPVRLTARYLHRRHGCSRCGAGRLDVDVHFKQSFSVHQCSLHIRGESNAVDQLAVIGDGILRGYHHNTRYLPAGIDRRSGGRPLLSIHRDGDLTGEVVLIVVLTFDDRLYKIFVLTLLEGPFGIALPLIRRLVPSHPPALTIESHRLIVDLPERRVPY